MTRMPVAQIMTADAYLDRPRALQRRRTELVAGGLVVHEPRLPHELACTEIHFALLSWTRSAPDRGLSTRAIDVLVDDHNVYAPDVLWYAEGRVPDRHAPRPYPLPDLVVEVRSPATWSYDIGAKKAGYERRGLSELWLADTEADAILVFHRSTATAPDFDVGVEVRRDEILTSPLLPGFELALERLFG